MIEKKEGGGERTGLKPAQVAASALAAVTAAFLGSTLGVTGTVVGAGLASVITSVGSELYLRSLHKTKEAARRTRKAAAFVADSRLRHQQTRRIEPPPTRLVNPLRRADDPTRRADDPTVRVVPGEQPTVRLPRPGQPLHATAPGPVPPATRVAERMPAESKRPWWKSPWTVGAGMGVLAFVIGMLVITGIETVTGHTLSGGQGTTLNQLSGGGGRMAPPTGAHPTPEQTPSVTETPTTKEPAVVSPQHRSTPSRSVAPSTEFSPTPNPATSETESSARPTPTTSSATPTSR